MVVIPKSSHKERMAENLDITDFELTAEDMEAIAALDTGRGLVVDFSDRDSMLGLFEVIRNYRL